MNPIWKYWPRPISPIIKAAKITDFVKNEILALLRPRIREARYKHVSDKNSFSHSKTPSARLMALIKDKPDTTMHPMAIGKIVRKMTVKS